jgi:hypothetical protein
MTVEGKLEVHLVHLVAPKGVPLTGRQIQKLCDEATREQREAAYMRSLKHIPFVLEDELEAAKRWVEGQ